MGTLVNDNTQTQLREIRQQLLTHGWIDKRVALEICDCDRLGARIYDLRHDPVEPMNIGTVRETKKNRFGHQVQYAVYRLLSTGETV